MTNQTNITDTAVAGLLSGAHFAKTRGFAGRAGDPFAILGTPGLSALEMGTQACSGKNGCKGKGGCKGGDNGCKGKNTCKGKGGCGGKDAR